MEIQGPLTTSPVSLPFAPSFPHPSPHLVPSIRGAPLQLTPNSVATEIPEAQIWPQYSSSL